MWEAPGLLFLLIFSLLFGFFVPKCHLCFTFRGPGGKGGLWVSFLSAWKDLGGVLCFPAAALREADLVPLQEPEPILALPGKEEGEFHARVFSVGGSDVHKQRLGAFINFPS